MLYVAASDAGTLSFVDQGGLTTSASPDTVVLYEPLTNPGKDGMNVLFADGHVELVDAKASQAMLSELGAGRNPPRFAGGR